MSHDTVLHRLVRPAMCRLAPTALRPNHVTALRLLTGLGAAAAFADGTPAAIRLGAGLFVLSALLDRADGELARLTGRFTRWGHRLDLVADCGCDALAFAAMGIGARDGWLGDAAPLLGAAAACGSVALFWLLNRAPSAASVAIRRLDPDDAVLAVPLIACLAGLEPVLLLAGIITPIAAIGLAWAAARPQPSARHRFGGTR